MLSSTGSITTCTLNLLLPCSAFNLQIRRSAFSPSTFGLSTQSQPLPPSETSRRCWASDNGYRRRESASGAFEREGGEETGENWG
ncbi:hypothetical protein BDR04DRAFT_1111263 [Suillus decipiens]|nr:hypothetical protein BDR04DRAFT_1111263 [Suillus decipiens]